MSLLSCVKQSALSVLTSWETFQEVFASRALIHLLRLLGLVARGFTGVHGKFARSKDCLNPPNPDLTWEEWWCSPGVAARLHRWQRGKSTACHWAAWPAATNCWAAGPRVQQSPDRLLSIQRSCCCWTTPLAFTGLVGTTLASMYASPPPASGKRESKSLLHPL